MGNFYVNYTVRSSDTAALYDALRGRAAAMTPIDNQCIVVFDKTSESVEPSAVALLAQRLSQATNAPVLAALVYDDDVLMLFLCEHGMLKDSYCSNPDFTGDVEQKWAGDAVKLAAAFGVNETERIDRILRKSPSDEDGYVFETDRHAALVAALGLPTAAVGYGYGYASQGELPEHLSPDQLIHVGAN
jgi:hypothetical protein